MYLISHDDVAALTKRNNLPIMYNNLIGTYSYTNSGSILIRESSPRHKKLWSMYTILQWIVILFFRINGSNKCISFFG